jgi:hypothetical protein
LEDNTSDVSKISLAMGELESNILALRQGGKISDLALTITILLPEIKTKAN